MRHTITRGRSFVMLLVFLCSLLIVQGCYTFSDELRSSIEGYVYLRNTEIPIENVEVSIESLRDSSFFTVYTDANGYFFQDDVHYGVNKVTFRKKSYYELEKFADVNHNNVFKLEVEMRASIPNKKIVTAVYVIDRETLAPIPNVLVDVYRFMDRDYYDESEGYWDYYTTVYSNEYGLASVYLGFLPRKEELEVEFRFLGQGYEEKHINFSVFFEDRQEIRTVDLVPLE